ncbi:hypothetical protein [Red seabream iridovirus]|uniref:ORF105 n=2 Tax=Infectious spleen and kidney necrosis virus TaxID=180170 RepID=A0A218PFN4_RSIV|nr:ORF121L [giant sea perch iridovirus - K1]QIQ54670.1 ORF105 [Red seabream iridovirus]UWH19259.1 hypothetical protein [Infectious spleen and kidney necrosis virus]WBR81595.1 hypothetical protein ORF119L [Spotted knifejaw iridovirus]QND75822.1 hypothetical protein ORF036 [Red seabream iridovirus]
MSYIGIVRRLAADCAAGRGLGCGGGDVLRSVIDPPYNRLYTPTLAFFDSEEEITIPFNFRKITTHFDSTDIKTIAFTRQDIKLLLATVEDKAMVAAGVSELYKDRCLAEFRVSDINNKIILLHLKFPNMFDTGLYKCTLTMKNNQTYSAQLGVRIVDRDLKYMLTSE